VHIVVPYRGENGKQRLDVPADTRARLALAMLADVLAACVATGPTLLVSDDPDAQALATGLGAEWMDDPGGGQGAAVAAAVGRTQSLPLLVVNADLPCVVAEDLRMLARIAELGGVGLVAAADGTTNALALPTATLFAPLYGPGSSARFRVRAEAEGYSVTFPPLRNLVDDVDTAGDVERLVRRVGSRTLAALEAA
jgi:2-phospho-L-lactate guanylyltransferase